MEGVSGATWCTPHENKKKYSRFSLEGSWNKAFFHSRIKNRQRREILSCRVEINFTTNEDNSWAGAAFTLKITSTMCAISSIARWLIARGIAPPDERKNRDRCFSTRLNTPYNSIFSKFFVRFYFSFRSLFILPYISVFYSFSLSLNRGVNLKRVEILEYEN